LWWFKKLGHVSLKELLVVDYKSADLTAAYIANPSAGNVQSVNRLWKGGERGNEVIDRESVLAQLAA
jgi:hypothetical protein